MSALGDLLKGIELPESREARERTIALLTGGPRRAQRSRPAAWRRVAAGLAVLTLAVFLAGTSAGRSTVSWAGELIGIGDVGGPPSLDDRPESMPPVGSQVVIGSGTAPSGDPYEVVAYTTRSTSGSPNTCAFVDFPGRDTDGGRASTGICLDGGEPDDAVQIVSTSFPQGAEPYTTGLAASSADRVDVRVGDRGTRPAELFRLDHNLQAQIGAEDPLTVFVAFLPQTITGTPDDPTVTTIAYGADGEEVGRDRTLAEPAGELPGPEIIEACQDALAAGVDHDVCRQIVEAAGGN